jgi:hypothetical protein
MGISHILFPDVYRAYYKAKRQDLLPRSLAMQNSEQEQILNTLIFELSNTIYGKEKNIDFNIENDYEVLTKLPLAKYEDVYPYIDRAWQGEESIIMARQNKIF